jgi:hypothetical protein
MKVRLDEASFPQLKEYCETHGLEVKVGHSTHHLRAKITTAFPGTQEIEVSEEVSKAEEIIPTRGGSPRMGVNMGSRRVEERRPDLPISHHKNDPTIEVFIPETKEPGGKREVEVAPNGLLFLVKRGQWVKVPYRVFEALNNAIETTYEDIPSQIPGMPPTRERYDTHAYPFNYRNGPSEEELAAWNASLSAKPGQKQIREAA